MHDVQFAVLEEIRATGISDDFTLYVSEFDALRVLEGTNITNSAFTSPEAIDSYEGTQDDAGVLFWRLDRSLARGVGRIEQTDQPSRRIDLSSVIR